MRIFILLCLVFSSQAFADSDFERFYEQVLEIRQDPSRLRETLVFDPEASGPSDVPRVRLFGEWDRRAWGNGGARNGDLVFLIGYLEDEPTRNEMRKFQGMIRWALDSGFRAVMDPAALDEEVREFVQSRDTAVIVWSSHGSADGRVWDARNNAISRDSFAAGATDKLKMFVLSNCSGDQTVRYYDFPARIQKIYWNGTTNSSQLFDYLFSSEFDRDLREVGFPL